MQTGKNAILDLEANCFSVGYKPQLGEGEGGGGRELGPGSARIHNWIITTNV